MFTINTNCYICCEKGKDKTVFLPEISGVEVTRFITSVESSEQFWRKICPIIGIFTIPVFLRVLMFTRDEVEGNIRLEEKQN